MLSVPQILQRAENQERRLSSPFPLFGFKGHVSPRDRARRDGFIFYTASRLRSKECKSILRDSRGIFRGTEGAEIDFSNQFARVAATNRNCCNVRNTLGKIQWLAESIFRRARRYGF